MIDALAIVLPFILVSAPLLKVLAYSNSHNRQSQGWFIALVGGTLALLALIGIHFFPQFDASITFVDYGLILFGAGVLLRPLAQTRERGNISGRAFYPALFVMAVVALFLMLPQGFYAAESAALIWAERLAIAGAWVAFAHIFAKQDVLDGLVALLSVLIAVGLAVMAKGVAVFALILAGCCMGFMRFNLPPAKVKMGFAGAFWLGFILFGLALIAFIPHPLTNPGCLTLITLFLWPLLDSLQALAASLCKKTPFKKNLWASRLLGGGMTESRVLLRSIGTHFLLFFLSILGYVAHQSLYTLLLGVVILLANHWHIQWLCKVKK